MSETRKLAAILAVDVVGYSRLMGEDEAGRRGECANVPTWRVLCELLMPPSRTAAFPPTCAVRSRDPQRQEYADFCRPECAKSGRSPAAWRTRQIDPMRRFACAGARRKQAHHRLSAALSKARTTLCYGVLLREHGRPSVCWPLAAENPPPAPARSVAIVAAKFCNRPATASATSGPPPLPRGPP